MTEHAKEFKLSELLMIADRHGGSVFTRSLYEFSKIAAKLEAENEKLNTISADLFKSRIAIIEHNEEMKTENEKLSAEIADLKEQLEIHRQHAKLDYLQIKSLNSKIQLLENKPKRHDPHDDEHLYGGNVC